MSLAPEESVARFRALHQGPLLILPNAGEAGSARVIEASGAQAIATSSSALAWVHGFPDGEQIDVDRLVEAVAEIVRAVRVPVSVDLEAGYAAAPEAIAEVVRRILEAGAVGLNLEDGDAPPEVLAEKIRVARRVGERLGVALFINARTDVYLHALVPPERRLAETLERARRYREAGGDGFFVPGVLEPQAIAAIAREAGRPLNVLAMPGLAPPAELERLGVRRLSLGGSLAQAALGATRRFCRALLERGEYGGLFDDRITYAEMNALLRRG